MSRSIVGVLCCLFLFSVAIRAQETKKNQTGVEIRGKTVDFFGIPWKGAFVELQSHELTSEGSKLIKNINTNDQGEFSFKDLPEGSYEITVYGGFGTLRETQKTYILQAGEVFEKDFGIEVGLTFCIPKQIYGIVKDSKGKAIGNSTVVLSNAFKQDYRRMVRSNSRGEYIVEVCVGGQYLVYAYAPMYEIQVKHMTIPKDTSKAFSGQLNFILSDLVLDKIPK